MDPPDASTASRRLIAAKAVTMNRENGIIMDTPINPAAANAATDEVLAQLRAREHASCFACRPQKWGGLGLVFDVNPDLSVQTTWSCPGLYQSYEGIVHGGVLATVLDCSMIQTLFARGIVARTGELTLRYHHPVEILSPLLIHAEVTESKGSLYLLKAEIRQVGKVCVRAHAKFMQTNNHGGSND